MQNEFNEQEYRRKLIEGGLSEADATDLAARTAAARRDSGSAGGAFRPAGSLFELPATAGDNEEKKPGFTDMVGRAKWDAWEKLKGQSLDEAKQGYIDLITSLR